VVAKVIDKQQPSDADMAKNLDQTRDQIRDQKQQEAFAIFANTVISEYRKSGRVRINAKQPNSPLSGE
jgi:peptidyl-prolyl cis-trans isomerase D